MWMRWGLPVVVAFALLPAPAEAQRGQDADRDGVFDHLDNCTAVPNPNQLNWDRDAFGDLCDPDFDNDGRVGPQDALYLARRLRSHDRLADLDGDGKVTRHDRTILRAYYGKAPGPGAIDIPPLPTCEDEKAQARAVCCGPFDVSPEDTSYVLIPTDCNCGGRAGCVPSDFIAQECLPADSVSDPPMSADLQCPPSDKLADEYGQGGDPACLASLAKAKEACGLAQDESLDLIGVEEGESVAALPICEALQDWKEEFTCDPWGGWRKPPLFTGPGKDAFDGLFNLDPEDGGWFPGEPKNDPPDPAIPIGFPFPSPEAANEPVRVIRAEVPGNFLRFHLENAALKPLLSQLDTQPGVDCDVSDLKCSFDVLNMKDLSDDIAQDFDENDEGVKFFVDKVPEGYEIHDIQFVGDDPEGVTLKASFTGTVTISAEGFMELDLRDRSFLKVLPVHNPRAANGYGTSLQWPDAQDNYLDRTVVFFGLTEQECTDLADTKVGDAALNGHYFTYATPFRCRCDDVNGAATKYCVADVYPRVAPVVSDGANNPAGQLPGSSAHYVYCSARDPLGDDPNTIGTESLSVNVLPLPGSEGPGLETLEAKLEQVAIVKGVGAGAVDTLLADVRGLACSGQYARRLPVGPQTPIDFAGFHAEFGKKVSSAIGLEAAVEVEMPTIVAEVSPGLILLDFDLGWKAKKWFKDEWWSFPLGWLIEWFLKIFSALASILSTFALNLINPVATVEFGDLELLLHGMISHRDIETPAPNNPNLKLVTPELTLGLRRAATNIPTVDVTPFDLAPNFSAETCDLQNAEDFVDWALALFVCPLELAGNLAKFGATPIIVLLKEFGNMVVDVFIGPQEAITNAFVSDAAQIEEDNDLGKLVASATRTVTLLPYYLDVDQNPANAPGDLGVDLSGLTPAEAAARLGGSLPPPFASLCLGSNAASVNCFLAKIFLGSADPLVPQLDVVRMGGKTHYRSLQDVTSALPISPQDYLASGLDWDYPPVRYCVGGDAPGGSTNYTSHLLSMTAPHDYLSFDGTGLLEQCSDFDEIEVDSLGNATPTDWRTQCAAFADVKITSLYYVRRIPVPFVGFVDAELLVQPTKRTNFLVDEVFFCPNDASCDLSAPNVPMRQRAELAFCSFLADFWQRVCTQPNCADNPPYHNVLQGALSSPPAVAFVVALMQRLATQVGQPQLSAELASLSGRLPQCVSDLEAKGFVIPEDLVVAP